MLMFLSAGHPNKTTFKASSFIVSLVRAWFLLSRCGILGHRLRDVRGRHLQGNDTSSSSSSTSANFTITSLANLQGDAARQNIIGTAGTPLALAQKVAGPSVTVNSATIINGNAAQFGTFTGGTNVIGFDEGIVLSTGKVNAIKGPNTVNGMTTKYNGTGYAPLKPFVQSDINLHDSAVLEIKFQCLDAMADSLLTFSYVFASEEYPEFVFEYFNDVFAFFLNGQNATDNIALLPDGTGVAIDTVNCGNPSNPSAGQAHCNLFIDNAKPNSKYDTQMDGFTVPLTVNGILNQNVENTITIAIADAGDDQYDSAVFIKFKSLECKAFDAPTQNPTTPQTPIPTTLQTPKPTTPTPLITPKPTTPAPQTATPKPTTSITSKPTTPTTPMPTTPTQVTSKPTIATTPKPTAPSTSATTAKPTAPTNQTQKPTSSKTPKPSTLSTPATTAMPTAPTNQTQKPTTIKTLQPTNSNSSTPKPTKPKTPKPTKRKTPKPTRDRNRTIAPTNPKTPAPTESDEEVTVCLKIVKCSCSCQGMCSPSGGVEDRCASRIVDYECPDFRKKRTTQDWFDKGKALILNTFNQSCNCDGKCGSSSSGTTGSSSKNNNGSSKSMRRRRISSGKGSGKGSSKGGTSKGGQTRACGSPTGISGGTSSGKGSAKGTTSKGGSSSSGKRARPRGKRQKNRGKGKTKSFIVGSGDSRHFTYNGTWSPLYLREIEWLRSRWTRNPN